MNTIQLPQEINYVGAFITFDCSLRCSYCINRFRKIAATKSMSADEWIEGLSRIEARADLPLTIQGGEPTAHAGFYRIARGLHKPMDLLTNLDFDIDEFMMYVPADKFKRAAPYASIRVSFHPEQMYLEDTLHNVSRLLSAGYQVGIWMVEHPQYTWMLPSVRQACSERGIDFRTKEFLGYYKGKLYGQYKYNDAFNLDQPQSRVCRTTELLIAPDGHIHRCHSDLYAGRGAIGHILDKDFTAQYKFRECKKYGFCNPCDVKVKNNRLQQFGHTSVEVVKE